ncbi:phage tail sheath C-terminal domain-containing protein [Fluviicola taffensis]|uniref:phage tail sheath C-terminal domain-containing protein n=1 Tax=Fluviicola taffensis TaxID=191579 RepID=UPI0031381AF7
MALTLNTPGVYVEEVNLLPPSVAQVATAVPAFIGYTEKALALDGSPLRPNLTVPPVPVRITSMLDYETQFGKAQNQQGITVSVVGNAIKSDLLPLDRSEFLMYYSMQMYFANGGGSCYIISVGDYSTPLSPITLKTGLTALEKEDEPTLIVYPDGTSLSADDLYGLYNDTLMQCHKLQDRFTIIDTRMSDLTVVTPATDFSELRTKISNDPEYIKYGAAYYPYLKTTIDYQYLDSDVAVSITTDADYDGDVTAINNGSVTNAKVLLDGYKTDLSTYETVAAGAPDIATALIERSNAVTKISQITNVSSSLISSLNDIIAIADEVISSNPPASTGTVSTLRGQIAAWITSDPTAMNAALITDTDTLNNLTGSNTPTDVATAIGDAIASMGTPDIGTALATLQSTQIAGLITALIPFSTVTTSMQLDAVKISNNALYNRIINSISQVPVLLPPSSSIAGVYAKVDGTSGVWKAPANTSLNYVIGPNYNISNDLQDGMNVDTFAGKSINAIRAFTGKGTLVWGARTLNGNSTEWKYISVRRFYNMVEESVKKATEGFVFQANDANTWVQVRAMIENFLILQWKAGALAGAKPEQAFFVRVGLGSTMTADDVLNGRMIVEIGMAVVRPAEFIVLRFSHMMQQA